jgi:hypothetical protein
MVVGMLHVLSALQQQHSMVVGMLHVLSALQQQHVQERSTRWRAEEASPPYAGLARIHLRSIRDAQFSA